MPLHGVFTTRLLYVSCSHPSILVNHRESFLRRIAQVVQHTRLVKSDQATQSHYDGFISMYGLFVPWYSASGFGVDFEEGHGSHVAGSAAGSLKSDAQVTPCGDDEGLDCLGGCLTYEDMVDMLYNAELDFEMLCPTFDCDNMGEPCLTDDVGETLAENGGVAQGAKLSIFDVSANGRSIFAYLALTGLWDSTIGTGCFIHSNSWSSDGYCSVSSESMAHDEYMFEV